MALWHITTRDAWRSAVERGTYVADSLAEQGFIHLSTDRQWIGVANRFYRGQTGLVLLSIREDKLISPVRYERADGDDFPHLYGPLPIDAVTDVIALDPRADGTFDVPASLAPWRAYFVQ